MIFVTGHESSPTSLVALDFPGVIFFFVPLILADKADRGSLVGTTEATEIPPVLV